MFVARSIAADHRDLIHDVSFDFHGRRMATCSSDQSVKVWDKSENGDWHCTASWKTHSGSVWRVTWAHPEFGQVLASCSFDRTAAVWEEIVGESNDKLRGQSHWVKRTTLVDSRTSVTDVKFAPKHMGLMLATCSADGVVRIYEAPDVMNLSQWSLQHEISCKLSCSCISWNPSSSRAHSPMIAVGSDDNSPNILAKVQIYEYNENTRKYAKAEALMTVTDPVHDIAFAPNLGRSFHILAVATKDVRIFTLKPLRKELTSSGGLTKFEIHIVAQFDNHNSQVWRVSWNITGTVLASSGDDGCVRLWKANYMDNWKCTGILKGNGSPVNGSSQQGIFNASLGSANTSLQNSLNGSSASRYFFPPLDSPRAGSRWSSHAQLLPPPPLIEQSCDADTANLQYPHPRRRCVSRPLNLLPENEGPLLGGRQHMTTSPTRSPGKHPALPAAPQRTPGGGGASLGGASRLSPNQHRRRPAQNFLPEAVAHRGPIARSARGAPIGWAGAGAGNFGSVPGPPGLLGALRRRGSFGGPSVRRRSRSTGRATAALRPPGGQSPPASPCPLCKGSQAPRSRCRRCRSAADGAARPGAVLSSLCRAMDNFRNIADETLPSFLGYSLNSSASVVFENVTVASNPGLPVAASTVARSQVGCDNRLSDNCASYLEGKHSSPSGSSHSSQSGPEPVRRLALCFRDDTEVATQVEEPQTICVSLKESHSVYEEQDQNVTKHSNHSQGALHEVLPLEQLEDLPTGMCFLPDLKNNKVGPSEPSEKLIEGEISSEHLSNSLSSFLENEKLTSLSSSDEDTTDDDIDDEEFFDNQLEAYFEQLIKPEMIRGDTNLENLSECWRALKLSENGLFQENFQGSASCESVTGVDSGSASDEDSQNEGITGCPVQREMLSTAVQQLNSMTTGSVLDSQTAAELQLDSLYLQCMDSHKADVSDVPPKQEIQSSDCQADAEVLETARGFLGHDTTPEILHANASQAEAPVCEVGLPDTYLSPTGDSCDNISLATTDKGDLPHSIVYQNEEGKWVTDLAYYTSFDEEQNLNLSEDDKINEEFITGSEAAAMIAQDQEEFEKAHRLVQAERLDSPNASELANTSWKSANSCILLRTTARDEDASYLRLSLGEFFGQRSEALGCLGGGSDVKRPSFGYYITSPKKRQPVALLRQSDSSGGDSSQEIAQLSEVLSDDLEAQTKDHANFTSSEGSGHGMDIAAGIHKSVDTEGATKSKAKDGIHKDKLEDGLSNHCDSVLSISTIATAIANASTSAEPSQLAAMMMALSNKSKRTHFLPGIVKEVELSAIQVLPSNEENSAFDMEKYLKKTDENGRESEYESIVKHEASAQNLISDAFLLGKDKNEVALAEDLMNNHSKQQEIQKRLLDYLSEESDRQNFSSLSGIPNHENVTADSVEYSQKLSDLVKSKHLQTMGADVRSDTLNGNEAHTCRIPLTADMEGAQRDLVAYQNNNLTGRCCAREDRETVDQSANAVSEQGNGLMEGSTGNILSLSNLKPAKQSSQYVSVSPTNAKLTQKLNSDERKQNAEIEKRNKDASSACGGNAKHVTFEKLFPTSKNSTDDKSIPPECGLDPLEDEQYSFRPSTSPLIHSSPSEASGTAFSGSEKDFTCPSQYQESPCKENVLPQSVYSSPSMSRLTYVSAPSSTCKNTAAMHDLETYQDENACELSTTIIRASPTPPREHTKEKLEDHSCQRSRKEAVLSVVDQKQKENELAGLQRKLDNVLDQEVPEEGFPKNEKQIASVPSNAPANHKEPDHVKSALLSKFCTFQPHSVNVDTQEVCQDQTNKAQRQGLQSENILPIYSGLSTYVPCNQNSSSEQYVPISAFKSYVTTSESQAISSVPPLLAGRSLAPNAFAQQHLGNIPSTGNTVLSQFHGCISAGFGLPAGLPCSGIPAGHVENPVVVGIPLGPNVGPGTLSAASLYNPHSTAWNSNILNIKSCTGQPLGAGRNEWELSKSPGIGHVKVPEELKFPNACCVGIASQTALSIYNPTERWLQVSIGVLSVSINGEKMDPMKYQCLVFKNKTIVGSYSTNDLKILFLPSHPGIFQCILNVSSCPVAADAETIVQSEALASRVVLTAVAENPNLEVEAGEDGLDFGDLSSGSWKALPLKLINKTHAFVPVRLIINANAVAWRCFTLSKEPVNTSSEQMDAVSQITAPSVVNHVIHASYDGQDPEALTVWVLFHAPKKQISSSDSLGPADEILARVDVEVDSPGPSTVIKSISLRARAGTARIHAPKDLQKIHLSTTVGSTAKQQLPLKNAGNISVYLKVKTSDQDSCFAVEPEGLFLFPGEEQAVTVLFSPRSITTSESTLKIFVLPSGPQYDVMIKGEVESENNRPVSTAAGCADIPPILSNKQFIAWGAVSLKSSVQKKLTLRNDSPSVTQHLRLLIRGQDQDCFQLQSIFGLEERFTSHWELKIRPKEDTNIYLMFTPTRVTCCFAKLEIKQLGIRSQPGIKFTIPLSGYGGTSNIILENVRKLSDSYMVTLDGLLSSRLRKASFHIRNTGSRAAYVRALCLANLQNKTVMDPQVLTVSPEKFVLREGTHEVVTVTWNPKEKNFHTANMLVSTVWFFCGDEVSRQQYRRAMRYEPAAEKHIIPENSLLKNIVFHEEFEGEKLVTEVCDVPRVTNDIRLFYANMQKVILSVVGYSTCDQDGFQQSPGHNLGLDRFENSAIHTNATLDVLPVKGPQGPSLPVKTNDLVQNKSDPSHTWAVKPEYLTLTCPSIGGTADTRHVQLVNNSNGTLTFELSWPAHCLTITPQHGVVEPESSAQILVSPNPTLATKPSLVPWSGLIYVHSGNGVKFIKVHIQEAPPRSVSGADLPCRRCDTFTPQSENPTIRVEKPLSRLPLTKMEIKNRNIVFPKTRPGQSSESYLEMENKGDENVKWNLSSFAPPYVKDVDGNGGVYRVTYSAFRCSRVSGTLEAHGQEKVAVIFLPRDKGDYSQFWDLECHRVEKPSWKHKLKFQLSGTSAKTENETPVVEASASALTKTEPERKVYSERRTTRIGQKEITQGVYAPEDHYVFPPTRVGETCTLKVNLRNNSFKTHMLEFVSPREPFYIKHLKYSLRSHHYINVPVQFKPKAEGMFEDLFVALTTEYGPVNIWLRGRAVAKR
ncbi:centrosomal protein of 192 kDa [Pithys albifrons albifrons]|uniref:centrosomal protein of 192 kDa n=1 Tax=Pithys albifrons albifrons TaxID=3385563 RepID=UPI003A5CCA7A